jgi:YggT family protein
MAFFLDFFESSIQITLNIARWIVLVHIIMSWLIQFQVLNLRQPFVSQVWHMLNSMLEPIYARVRRLLPQISGIDLAPLALLVFILALQQALARSFGLPF